MEYNSHEHAIHNEKVCNELLKNIEFGDWVITTAFYSSLHYLRHAIFPLKFTSTKLSATIKVETFNRYCLIEGYEGKKHSVFKKLVETQCPTNISVAYHRLLDASYTARYNNYKFSENISKQATDRLILIKEYTKKKKQTK